MLKTDKDIFIKEVDRFRDLILQSSDHVSENEETGVILKRGYLDLVPLNCFALDGEYIFYDQEFYEENCPANAIIMRMIDMGYKHTKLMLFIGNTKKEGC